MSNFSDFLENKLLDITLKAGTAYTVAQPKLALFTTDPTDDGSGNECDWTGYARQNISFGTIANGVANSTGTVTFPAVAGADVTVTHIGIYDANTGGNLLYHSELTVAKSLSATDVLTIPANGVSVTLS